MIEKLKSILVEIQKERSLELSKITSSWMRTEELNRQKSLLALELPFSTNHKDIMLARAAAYAEKDQKRKKKRSKTAYQIITEWKNSGSSEEVYARGIFCDRLQQAHVLSYHRDLGHSTEPIIVQELVKSISIDPMIDCINRLGLSDTQKDIYLNYAEDLLSFINRELLVLPPMIFKKKQPLSLVDAEKLFEYLECRALKSSTIRAYADLLLCRALLYTPLPAKKLFALSSPLKNSTGWIVRSGAVPFGVPASFVALWKGFLLEDRLLPTAFDEDHLSKKIRRLGKHAGLPTVLNPSILRLSIEPILNSLGIDSSTESFLPPR